MRNQKSRFAAAPPACHDAAWAAATDQQRGPSTAFPELLVAVRLVWCLAMLAVGVGTAGMVVGSVLINMDAVASRYGVQTPSFSVAAERAKSMMAQALETARRSFVPRGG
jgi:hypothetical protein